MPIDALAVREDVTALALAHAEARYLTHPDTDSRLLYMAAIARHQEAIAAARALCVIDLFDACPVHHVVHHDQIVTADTEDLWFA